MDKYYTRGSDTTGFVRKEDVDNIKKLFNGLNAYINIIPYNEVSENDYRKAITPVYIEVKEISAQNSEESYISAEPE